VQLHYRNSLWPGDLHSTKYSLMASQEENDASNRESGA
jgi:hypothetical protein